MAAAILALPLRSAWAQDSSAPPAPTDAAATDTSQLQAVTVTATRRSENIKDVPISASVISGENLDVLTSSGNDLRLLAARVPSLNVESSFGRAFPRFYIRGYGNTDFNLNASQPVSLVYDDVVQENPILKGFPIFDLDQVEVLRGPQGTLFGRNTPAGVVKFDSAKPTFDHDGYFNASDATFNTSNVEGAVNIPINSELALRFSGLYQHRDDWVSNAYSNTRNAFEGYDDGAARLQLLYKPTQDFTALFNVHGRDLSGTARLFRANIFEPGTDSLVPGFSPGSVALDGQNAQHLHSYGSNVRLQWNLDGFALHSITAYETVGVYSRGDIDGGYGASYSLPQGPGVIPFSDETAAGMPKHKQITQEIRAESLSTGPLKWQTGAYYFYEGFNIDDFAYDTLGGGGQNEYESNRQKNVAWAVFASTEYDLTRDFDLRGGVRFTQDKKYFDTPFYIATDGTSLDGAPAGGTAPNAQTDVSKVNWDLSGTYKLSRETNVYARIATGFRAPSIEPASAFSPQSVARSENVVSYEIGTKTEFLQHRVRISFDLFDYTVKGQQLTAVGGQNNSTVLLNAAKTIGRGAELDMQLRPIQPLLITLGGSYNFTEIKDPNLFVGACGDGCVEQNPAGPVTGTVAVDGNPLPQAPKLVGNFTMRYGIPIGANGEAFAYTDWSYRSQVDFYIDREAEGTGKPLLEGGLRLGYDWNEGKYELAAFSRNITNRIVAVGGINFDNLTGFINDPRIIGAQFKARF